MKGQKFEILFSLVGVVFCFWFCLGHTAFAQSQGHGVIINEIAWAGTTENWRNEWIELYNVSTETIDLANWQIENGAAKNEAIVIENGQIAPSGYFLICRAEIGSCDFIATKISLHNEYQTNGELILKNAAGQTIDQTPLADPSASSRQAWPGGDNATKQTMERTNPLADGLALASWQSSQESNGTPKEINSSQPVIPSPLPAPLGEDEESQPFDSSPLEVLGAQNDKKVAEPRAPLVYPENILLNEVMPSPEGSDADNEWLEIFNANNFAVDLANWQIKDIIGATKTYTFPEGSSLAGLSYIIVDRPISKITLQNSGDGLLLLNPAGQTIDQVDFPKASQGMAYCRNNQNWAWSNQPTPGQKNIIGQNQSADGADVGISDVDAQKNISRSDIEILNQSSPALAQISQGVNQKSNKLLTIIIAIAIALGSAIVVLIITLKTKSDVEI